MKNVSYAINKNYVSIVISGKSFLVLSSDSLYPEIIKAIRADDIKALEVSLDKLSFIKKKISSEKGSERFEFKNNTIYRDGVVMNGKAIDKVISFITAGNPPKPLLKFLERLYENPSMHSVEQTLSFLEHGKLPITDDGYFLGYKSVAPDWTDWYTRKISNTIGAEPPPFPRNEVDDNYNNSCSRGYHVGTIQYATNFNNKEGRHIIIVRVDPADVVSVSGDSDEEKIRLCKYKVIAEYINDFGDYTEKHNVDTDHSSKYNPDLAADTYSFEKVGPKRDSKGRFCK